MAGADELKKKQAEIDINDITAMFLRLSWKLGDLLYSEGHSYKQKDSDGMIKGLEGRVKELECSVSEKTGMINTDLLAERVKKLEEQQLADKQELKELRDQQKVDRMELAKLKELKVDKQEIKE